MSWLYAALGAAFLWGLVQTIDKLSVGRLVRYVPAYVTIIATVGIVVASALLALGTPVMVGPMGILLSCLSGGLTILYTFLFLTSLRTLDAPEASTILLLVPIVSTVIGASFFGERIGWTEVAGIAVILAGAYLATREEEQLKPREKIEVLRAVGLLVVTAVIISLQRAVEKYALDAVGVSTESVFFWERIAVFIAVAVGTSVLPGVRRRVAETLGSVRPRVVTVPLFAEVCALAATYAGLAALVRGPFGVTNTIISASPVFALLIVSGLNTLGPDTIPDSGSGRQFLPRMGAILLTVVGLWILRL